MRVILEPIIQSEVNQKEKKNLYNNTDTHTHIHIYIHTYTHTHTHIYIYTYDSSVASF